MSRACRLTCLPNLSGLTAADLLTDFKCKWRINLSPMGLAQCNLTCRISIVIVIIIKICLHNPISRKAANSLTLWWICWNDDAYWPIHTSENDSSAFQALDAAVWAYAAACGLFISRVKVTVLKELFKARNSVTPKNPHLHVWVWRAMAAMSQETFGPTWLRCCCWDHRRRGGRHWATDGRIERHTFSATKKWVWTAEGCSNSIFLKEPSHKAKA